MAEAAIDNLTIEIGATSKEATNRIDIFVETLERLKGVAEDSSPVLTNLKTSFDKAGNLKGVSANFKDISDNIKKSKPDYSSLAGEVEFLAEKFAGLTPEASKLVTETARAEKELRALSGVKAAPSLDEAADAMKRLSDALDVGDISGVADAFKYLPSSAQKSIQAFAKVETAGEKLEAASKGVSGELKDVADASKDTSGKLKDVADAAEGAEGKFGALTVAAGNLISSGLSSIVSGIGDMGRSIFNLDQTTEAYRVSMGKLNTAFESAGYGPDVAQGAYSDLFSILGDSDQATEAAQLLAKLSASTEDMSKWTDVAAGIVGTFGDALPIEGLIEAANETAKVGKVAGTLADALNWAGISEDRFNGALAGMTTEAERNRYIMDTLSGLYDEAGDAFYRNNKALITARENQAALDEVTGKLGNTISVLKSDLLSGFLPAITEMGTSLNSLLTGDISAGDFGRQLVTSISGLASQVGDAVSAVLPGIIEAGSAIISELVSTIADGLPELIPQSVAALSTFIGGIAENSWIVLDGGLSIITGLVDGIMGSLPVLIDQAPELLTQFASGIADSILTMQKSGAAMLESIATGIMDAIPKLLDTVPELVGNFLSVLTDKGPEIIRGGLDAALNLISGILDGLPKLISSAGEMVSNFLGTIGEHFPDIVSTGVQILIELGEGIIKSIPDLVKAVPEIIGAIVDAFADGMSSIVDIGKSIVEGLWTGIKSLGSWIGDKVGGFFGGIVDGVKGFLDINSPSRVFAEIGGFMVEGIGVGWDEKFGGVARSIEQSVAALPLAVSIPVSTNMSAIRIPSFNQTASSIQEGQFAAAVRSQIHSRTVNNTYEEYNSYAGQNSGKDTGEIISAIFAGVSRLERAIQESDGTPVYIDGRLITSSQNQRNRLYGKTLQNT